MRHRRHQYSENTGSLLGTLFKYSFVLLLLAALGGATWLALTPMDAPTKQVIRQIPHERLGPA